VVSFEFEGICGFIGTVWKTVGGEKDCDMAGITAGCVGFTEVIDDDDKDDIGVFDVDVGGNWLKKGLR